MILCSIRAISVPYPRHIRATSAQMLKTNAQNLIESSVAGEVSHPTVGSQIGAGPGLPGFPGPILSPGGVFYNVKLGDPVLGWDGFEIAIPGVAVRNPDETRNSALLLLACIGNKAYLVRGGDSKPPFPEGMVIGKHKDGFVIVAFPRKALETIVIGDRVQIRAVGQGLKFADKSEVMLMNCSNEIFKNIPVSEKGQAVRFPVVKILPSQVLAPGARTTDAFSGDFDMQYIPGKSVYNIEELRIGDFVAITDYDFSTGLPRFVGGAISVAIIVHGGIQARSRGPGLCPIMTSASGLIDPVVTKRANLADIAPHE